jgi:hypothetical protein
VVSNLAEQASSSSSSLPGRGQPTAKADQRLQFRVTLVGVIGALLGALIGGAATLVGTIYQQHSAAASQIQSERQNSYVAYNVAMDNFDAQVTGVLLQAKLGLMPTMYVNEVINAEGALQRAGDQVGILASSRLLRIVRSQQKSAEILDIEAQALRLRMSDPKLPVSPGVPAESTLIAELSSGDLSFAKVEKGYENDARIDLGTN